MLGVRLFSHGGGNVNTVQVVLLRCTVVAMRCLTWAEYHEQVACLRCECQLSP